ncbi:glycosyltransferase family 2 protein [Lactobacillus sp. LC28-10]|uniref:Glycosyltransferase family 2 protein n=1 Tax=Secundilactobacillus angelensis TaxID=2722706 RepID=A0ABX1KWD2_9LACO|nr:glycosyltransferase family 2 protein [Secundilactobacillus angelensis]MCH5461329.1 glycosyltransferase family 2 protein [Secundilactobacillus angelensis]NLR17475.1 glycosyltransferase family 2 protein [Secundilactobacillus angelensis]
MSKLVSIIIPYHNETLNQLRRVLSSINNQTGIDFTQVEVILIGDGAEAIDGDALFEEFENLDARYYGYEDSLGAGVARQVGMDISSGDYYMFVDADDELQNTQALWSFFNAVKAGDHQVIIARYVEEIRDADGTYQYVTHPEHNWQTVAAKWFNRKYISSLSLTWREDLQFNEDTYFVGLACAMATDISYLDKVVYIWLWHEDAIKRALAGQLDQWVEVNRYLLEKIRDQRPEQLVPRAVAYFADIYLRAQRFPAADQETFQREHAQLVREFASIWPNVSALVGNQIDHLLATEPAYKGLTKASLMAFLVDQIKLLQVAAK